MGDSSDSEEFYDAEEFTPIKGSKRASISKSTTTINSLEVRDKDKPCAVKTADATTSSSVTSPEAEGTDKDDRPTVKNAVQDRRRFQELRRCMQTEEEEEEPDPAGSLDQQTFEHPFKIVAHDTMSLQSMTSLGKIGRILSGASESHPNIQHCYSAPASSSMSRDPSTLSEERLTLDRTQIVMAEPDVIASTKANSLKHSRGGACVVTAGGQPRPAMPVAPPRRRKRNKLHGSQSLSTTDGDNLSICTNDTDDYYVGSRNMERPTLDSLHSEPILPANQSMSLPSPASTIESLTREFQDSLELTHSKYGSRYSASSHRTSPGSSRSSTGASVRSQRHIDAKEARGDMAKAQDEDRARNVGSRTQSESRAAPGTGHSSLGSSGRRSVAGTTQSGRRRSCGDEQQPLFPLRARSTSGQHLTDMEILEQVTVLNLDTGERVPLSVAEHKLPQCINPLSLHIMRLTSEYIGRENDDENTRETDEESETVCAGGAEDDAKETKLADRPTAIKKQTEKFKRFIGTTVKKTVDAAKSLAQEVSHARHKEDVSDIADDVRGETNIKLKASNSHKGPYDFDGCIRHVQEMGDGHSGAVWCCKFSVCGRLLATAGQDKLLRVWVTRDAYHMFQDMRTKYNLEQKCSPSPSQEHLPPAPAPAPPAPLPPAAPFQPEPFAVYAGHTSELLDVSWSKNYFILSSSMDKTVRLWHISRGECLCCFQHIDFVTAIVFHPRDDSYFLSGSLDGKLRLWNIPDKKVAVWNEVTGKSKLITAANFCQNGKFAVVGTYDGRCIFYTTDQLKYHTQIDVRSTRGKNSTGRKISGVEPMPNDDKILVTSNDSRIRLYDLRDLNLSCKYKGYVNVSSQIKASFSHDGKYIVAGSENQCIYIWKTYHDYSKFTSVRRDRNYFWEGIKAHNAVVTCAVFAPNPEQMLRTISEREHEARRGSGDLDAPESADSSMVASSQTGQVLVSADFSGRIKVFVHKAKPKHGSLPASALA